MIDPDGLKIHEEIMKFSFLENFEDFGLQLLYWCCSIIFRTFNLRNTYSANIFRWLAPFYVNCKKTSKA